MQPIRLNYGTGVPVFRQIVEQIAYMIELGQLNDGDRLPSSRMLAANLHVNRNTVARAYSELGKRGLVGRQGRLGMVVRGASQARDRLTSRDSARAVLISAVSRCLELGLAPDEIASLAYQQSLHAKRSEVQLAFVECNVERAEAFAAELGDALDLPVAPFVLGGFEPGEVAGRDLVVTTFFHLAEVRRLVRDAQPADEPEVLGIVVAPHLKTLVRLSQIPKGHRIGIFYTTDDQAEAIRQSLADTGVDKVDVITGRDDPAIAGCDLVIVPSESPDLADQIRGKTQLLEWGNVLDASSVRMVREVVDEVRERKGSLAKAPAASLAAST
ncbi:MAG TPA: GntR family transcriptional regulator [Gaiellaceae bacterium]|nr:GntR family transcriptional regulator [Gaiellaceae bacterium]